MPRRVDVPDLGVVEFPDDMDDAAVSAAIRKSLDPLEKPGLAPHEAYVQADRQATEQLSNNLAPRGYTARYAPGTPPAVGPARQGTLQRVQGPPVAVNPQAVSRTAPRRNEAIGGPPPGTPEIDPRQFLGAPPIAETLFPGKQEGIPANALKGLAEVYEIAFSPLNAALGAATATAGAIPVAGKAIQTAAGTYFTADMLEGLYHKAPEFKSAIDRGDIGEATRLGINIIAEGALAAVSGKHVAQSLRGSPRGGQPLPTEEPRPSTDVRRETLSTKAANNISEKSKTSGNATETIQVVQEDGKPLASVTVEQANELAATLRRAGDEASAKRIEQQLGAPARPSFRQPEIAAAPGDRTPVGRVDIDPVPMTPRLRAPGVETSRKAPSVEVTKQEVETVAPGKVVENFPVQDISVDPARFQFKQDVGQKGVTEELKGVQKFDPEKAGVVSVWRDPADQKTYVVNGHHRVELADRTGTAGLTVRFLDAKNATEARTKGALINIAEGRGTATDAAKVFRDSGLNEKALEAEGISLKGAKAAQGLALARLDPKIFSDVVSGDMPVERAVIIGRGLENPADQVSLLQSLRRLERSGQRPTNSQIEEMIRLETREGAPTITEGERAQQSLFGTENLTRRLIPEKAAVSDFVRGRLRQDKKLFELVSNAKSAQRLEKAGNVIKVEENAAKAGESAQAQELYDRLSTSTGKINDILEQSAVRLANGDSAEVVKEQAYARIRAEVLEEARKLTGAPAERPKGNGEGRPDQTSAGEFNPEAEIKAIEPKRGERGAVSIPKEDVQAFLRRYSESVPHAIVQNARSLGSRVAREGEGAGRPLMSMIERYKDLGEVSAGRKLAKVADLRASKLSKEDRLNVVDVLEGRAKPANEATAQAAATYREITEELAAETGDVELVVRTKDGKREFRKRANYFPHITPPTRALVSGPIRNDIIANIVRLKIKPNTQEATKFLDDYVEFLESGKRRDSLLEHMVESGQAVDEANAYAQLLRYRAERSKRSGSLEFSREVDLPFYDPDPVRVMPHWIAENAIRIQQIKMLGQDNEMLHAQLLRIEKAGGNAKFVESAVNRMIGKGTNTSDTAAGKVSRFLRGLSTLKLSVTSTVTNATQNLNTLLATDVPTLAYGVRGLMTKSGRRLAIESGAAIEPVLAEAQREIGGGPLLNKYMTAIGFSPIERANRVVAANAGKRWAEVQMKAAKAGGEKGKRAQGILNKLGIDATAAVKRGSLTDQDLLMAAKKMSDATQFRSRPEDLAEWFSSHELAKALLQFKSFSYQQSRFIADQTFGEMKRGNFGRGVRNIAILGALYPAVGEVVRMFRNWVTDKNDEEFKSNLTHYLDSWAQVGSLGLFMDISEAIERGREQDLISGPLGGQASELGTLLRKLNDDDAYADEKMDAIKKYVLYRFGSLGRRIYKETSE